MSAAVCKRAAAQRSRFVLLRRAMGAFPFRFGSIAVQASISFSRRSLSFKKRGSGCVTWLCSNIAKSWKEQVS
jgi:hypothetical protein